MPGAVKSNNLRFPASYANFYIGNHVVLYPSYDHPNDHIAENLLKKYFPTRQIVGISSRALIKGQGGVHCITQQQPERSSA
jgi:agmatine deiminase